MRNLKIKVVILIIIMLVNIIGLAQQGFQHNTCEPTPVNIKTLEHDLLNDLKLDKLPKAQRDGLVEMYKKQAEDYNKSDRFNKILNLAISAYGGPNNNGAIYLCKDTHITIDVLSVEKVSKDYVEGALNGSSAPGPRLTEDFPTDALIGYIGSGRVFMVGYHYEGKVEKSGYLHLQLNAPMQGYIPYPVYSIKFKFQITPDDPCKWGEGPSKYDVIIYWKDGLIRHSGIVMKTSGCKVESVASLVVGNFKHLFGDGEQICSPDDENLVSRFGDNWTVYHTDRSGTPVEPGHPETKNNLNVEKWSLDKFDVSVRDAVKNDLYYTYVCTTDKGNHLLLPTGRKSNCHGYTFNKLGNNIGLFGYMTANSNIPYYNDKPVCNQCMAAKIILRDNDYRQVHAESVNSKEDRWRGAYNILPFKLPGDGF